MEGTTIQPPIAQAPDREAASPTDLIARYGPFTIALGFLTLAFAYPLGQLLRYSLSEEMYSHVLLIPFICGYLIWSDRKHLPLPQRGFSFVGAGLAFLGVGLLAIYALGLRGGSLPKPDFLFWTVLPFCLLLSSLVLFAFGLQFAKSMLFPVAFFFFITPFPEAVTNAIEIASQVGSAEVYSWMMQFSGTPFLRDGQRFQLPGLTLVVAQECSGIRSSFVLFLTSLLAGHMFLKSSWRKGFLAFAVIPLGLIRNGFRVLAISLLTVHWDPGVIHSPLHHRGGPIFFALSLIPFFLLLFWLRKSERAKAV